MSSSIKLTNSSGKIVTITNPDTTSADVTVDLLNNAYTIATVNDFGTVPVGYTTVIVKDTDRGGIFVWSASGTANGGTVFAGSSGYWVRQYSGAVNVKWFGVDIQKAMTYVIGRGKKVAFDFNATIRIPADSPTLQQAIDSIEASQGVTIDLLIESGHQPSAGISVSNGDYSCFTISSVDAEVLVSATINTAFLYANNAKAPSLNCLINAQGNVFQGCYYVDQSTGNISRDCGVKNVRERGLYVGTSTVSAGGCNFSGAGQDGGEFGRCLWATRGATVNCEEANFTGCAGNAASMYISRASTVHAASVNVDTINSELAVWVHRASRFNAQNANISGNVYGSVVRASRGSTVVLNEAKITVRGTGSGVRCFDVSSVHLEGVTIQVGSGTPNVAVWCSGGKINLPGTISPGFNIGIIVEDGGEINAVGAIIGAVTGTPGVLVQRGGKAVFTNADLRTNGTNGDVGCSGGSIITLNGATTTNSVSPGIPNVDDTSAGGRGGFNSFISSARGIIFA